jgi:hypothetical protein
MPMLIGLFELVLLAFAAHQGYAASSDRSLAQADGPGIVNKPLSATPADLVNDPSGRAHLLVRMY